VDFFPSSSVSLSLSVGLSLSLSHVQKRQNAVHTLKFRIPIFLGTWMLWRRQVHACWV
jgi:hypothetical protein